MPFIFNRSPEAPGPVHLPADAEKGTEDVIAIETVPKKKRCRPHALRILMKVGAFIFLMHVGRALFKHTYHGHGRGFRHGHLDESENDWEMVSH